jgi:hypothetical protein
MTERPKRAPSRPAVGAERRAASALPDDEWRSNMMWRSHAIC